MYIKDEWIGSMYRSVKLVHPNMSKEKILTKLNKIFDKRFKDSNVQLYNDYEEEITDLSLSGVLDWIQQAKPTIAESGVFFYPRKEMRNVNTEIIKEDMLDKRTIHKKEMFKALDAGDTFLAAIKNIQQGNDKKAANSGYGAEAESSSFLFNLHSAMSVTSCGRGQLSVACQCFENLLSDYVKFKNMDDFYVYINNIVGEKNIWKFKTSEIVDKIPSKKKFMNRMIAKFFDAKQCKVDVIEKIYENLSDELKCRVYFKSNIRAFLLNAYPTKLYEKIVYSNEEYVDPNNIPPDIYPVVMMLTELVTEFVNYRYQPFRYENRTKFDERDVTIVMDTDSNFIYYDTVFEFVMNHVVLKPLFKKRKEREAFEQKVLNVLSCFTTYAIKDTLEFYLGTVNVDDDDKKYIKMKNEFEMSMVIVTFAKKSYIGLIKRQEAHVYNEPKLDVKGVNFFKSTSAASTTDFIYNNILMDELLQPKDEKIILSRINSKIHNFKNHIANKIKNGNMGYLKRSIRVKSSDGYKDPLRIGQYKAVYVWNKVCKQKDLIDLPATVTIVKVTLNKIKDVAELAEFPEIYEKMMYLFENDENIKEKGIKSIALPVEMDEVPKWVLKIIDVETLVSDNMKLFTQLYRPIGFVPGSTTHNGSSMTYYTNIVKI